jgi:hypothetical protein
VDTEYSSGTNFGVRNVPFVAPSLTLQLKTAFSSRKHSLSTGQIIDWRHVNGTQSTIRLVLETAFTRHYKIQSLSDPILRSLF